MLKFHDDRRRDAQRYDAICDQVIAMNELVKELVEKIPQGQTQTVLYKTEGPGVWIVICTVISAVVSIMCIVVLIVAAILIVPDFHDIKAWQDILRRDVARLQAAQQQAEKAK